MRERANVCRKDQGHSSVTSASAVVGGSRWVDVGGRAHVERADVLGVDAQDAAAVVEFAAVVGRREDGDEALVPEELVAVLHHLRACTYVYVCMCQW